MRNHQAARRRQYRRLTRIERAMTRDANALDPVQLALQAERQRDGWREQQLVREAEAERERVRQARSLSAGGAV